MYVAASKTFHSTRVTRYLIELHIASADYDLAERALEVYEQIIDKAKKTRGKGVIVVTSIPDDVDLSDQKDLQEMDTDADVLLCMTQGVRLQVKFLKNAKKAVDIARRAAKYCAEWNVMDDRVNGEVWHAMGLALSLYSDQLLDGDKREEYHQTALEALQKALQHLPTFTVYYHARTG